MANTIPVPPEHQFPELTVLSGEQGRPTVEVELLNGWPQPRLQRC